MSAWARRSIAIGIAVLAVGSAAAQSGGISVAVRDWEGRPLPGATVTISHDTGYVKTTAQLTDERGIVEFPVLRPGAGYAVEVAFPGFNTIRQDGLRVRVDTDLVLPLQMIEGLEERVRVSARNEVISLDTVQQSSKFSEDFIADLPVLGRSYQNVLTMTPGVQDPDGDGNPNVHGSRTRDFQAIVGGVSNVDPLTGQFMSRINPNSIEEMEVITSGAGVEFGRAQGGYARIIQKQGSNTHEGVAEFYFRTSKLDGDGASDRSGVADADFDWYQPAAQLSGPLIKDKLWYRVSLELRDAEQPTSLDAGIVVSKTEEKTNDFQLTWQVSPRNKLALQYRHDPRRSDNIGVSSIVSSRSTYGFDREGQTTTLTWTAPYSPKVLVESTVSWQDLNLAIFPNTAGVSNSCVTGKVFLEQARCTDDEGRVSGSHNLDSDDHRQRLSVNGNATLYGGRFWGMSHQFKLGARSENERYFRDLTLRADIDYSIVETPGSPEVSGLAIADLAVPQEDSVRATGTNWAFYVEDQVKPHPSLAITLGARVDREEIEAEGRELFDPGAELDVYHAAIDPFRNPLLNTYNPKGLAEVRLRARSNVFTAYEDFASFETQLKSQLCDEGDSPCRSDVQLSIDALARAQKDAVNVRRAENVALTNTNVSPYLAVAWDPFRDGKSAIKASAGRHYNNIPLLVPLRQIEPAVVTLIYDVDLDNNTFRLRDGISPSVTTTMLDPDLQTPYQDEFTLSFERELWAETSLGVTYIRRSFHDQLQDRNVNVDTGDHGRCLVQTSLSDPLGNKWIGDSWGTGEVQDPHSGVLYVDDDPGVGDGRTDDCLGRTIEYAVIDVGDILVQRPDGLPDLYKQNPFWGDILVIGNFNEIDYEAWVLDLVRRQYRSWELQGSYTYSSAKGDGEDFEQSFDNDPSVAVLDVSGHQSYDQRHVVKLNATTITPWGVRLGTAVSWQSGLPYSIVFDNLAFDTLPPETSSFGVSGARSRITYPTGVRNDQRNQAYWNLDLKMTKELHFGRRLNLQLSVEVFNALADDTYQVYNTGFERGLQINGTNEAIRRFGREWQLGMKLAF